jgi:hypothetical protein
MCLTLTEMHHQFIDIYGETIIEKYRTEFDSLRDYLKTSYRIDSDISNSLFLYLDIAIKNNGREDYITLRNESVGVLFYGYWSREKKIQHLSELLELTEEEIEGLQTHSDILKYPCVCSLDPMAVCTWGND